MEFQLLKVYSTPKLYIFINHMFNPTYIQLYYKGEQSFYGFETTCD